MSAAVTAMRDLPTRVRRFHPEDIGVAVGSALAAVALVWIVYERLTSLTGASGFWFLTFLTFLTIQWLVVRETRGRKVAADRTMTALVSTIAIAILVPLVMIVAYVVAKGIHALRLSFFTQDLKDVGPLSGLSAGGALHAIIGTIEQVAIAVLFAVPLGVTTAVFLNEVGGRLRRPVRIFVDAMSGVPSIVAGLFIYSVWIVQFHHTFSGIAASFALAILMLPTVTRTCEEVLRLVPDGIREASLALGAPEWKTTMRVVLPTARSGVITAAILGVARAIGETAPLIMTSFGASVMNANPVKGAQDSLPLFVYNLIRFPQKAQVARAWTGALVLMMLVLILFTVARIAGRTRIGASAATIRGENPIPTNPHPDEEHTPDDIA